MSALQSFAFLIFAALSSGIAGMTAATAFQAFVEKRRLPIIRMVICAFCLLFTGSITNSLVHGIEVAAANYIDVGEVKWLAAGFLYFFCLFLFGTIFAIWASRPAATKVFQRVTET